ncbi:MAG TPA: outer membrane protein assembly factor BamD [Candidatus Binatia bacterium]|jgi:outer membrane protein assembly factor BamD
MTRLAIVLVALVATAGCGSSTKPKLSADAYYKDASDAFAKRNYDVAANHYKELLDQYPFDPRAEEAELKIATAHYKSHHYPEAIAAFNDFQRMHPMSPHLAQVYYLLGKSYMDQMTTTDRDQGASENAHGWFRVVIERYPTSPYAAKAQHRLVQCRYALADHELRIARYYLKRGNLKAGENRVKGLLENYPDAPATTRGLMALADAYAKVGDHEHESVARAAIAERPSPEDVESKLATSAPKGKKSDRKKDKSTQTAAADPPAGADDPPARVVAATAPTVSGPASTQLLADLTARYGPGQGVSTAATSPSLLDPVKNKASLLGDRAAGGGAGAPSSMAPLGGY